MSARLLNFLPKQSFTLKSPSIISNPIRDSSKAYTISTFDPFQSYGKKSRTHFSTTKHVKAEINNNAKPLQLNEKGKKFDGISFIDMEFCGGQPITGTEKAPAMLRDGLMKHLKIEDDKLKHKFVKVVLDDLKNGRSAASCSEAARRISEAVSAEAKNKNFCLNVGGDHSVGTGTMCGLLDSHQDLFVIWIDAHADINTYHTSNTKNVHGMPVSFLIDDGEIQSEKIAEYKWTDTYRLKPSNIFYIGLRDVDPEEQVILEKLNITHYPMTKIDDESIDSMLRHISSMVKRDQPVHVSFDVDALDPKYTPSTGTAVKNGLSLDQILKIGDFVRDNLNLVGLDLVEVNPLIGDKSDVENTVKYSILTASNFIKKQ